MSWKNTYITPIFKSDDRNNNANYKGVCVQLAIPKLFDQFITVTFLKTCKHIILNEQYGFLLGRSTVTNPLT